MREIMRVNSVPKAISFLTTFGSIGLIIFGIYGESYWSGFGLVLLMTSLLLILSFSSPEGVVH